MSLKEDVLAAALVKVIKDRVADADRNGRADLLAQLVAAHEAMGVKSVSVELPDGTKVGTVTLTSPRAGVHIDDDAFLAWVAAEHPTEVVRAVREPFRRAIAARLKIVGDDVIDTATGEAVAWASVRPAADKPTSFSVRFADGGREEIERAWRDGRLDPLAHLAAPALPAGGEQ